MEFNFFLGCDISQDSFHYCLRDKSNTICQGSVQNTPKSIKRWIGELRKNKSLDLSSTLFCLEHTGIYSLFLLRELHAHHLVACMESSMNIKLSLGLRRGKNDKIDAQRIAEYAMRNMDKLKQWQPKRDVIERLQILIKLRDRLVRSRKDITRTNEDAKRFFPKEHYMILVRGSKDALAGLEKSILAADREIEQLIQGDETLTKLSRLILSVDGIGIVTCCMLLVRTNEFKDINEAKKLACTSGIAPFERSSGTSLRGKSRVSHYAHKDLKALLHLCAMVAVRQEGTLKEYYTRKVGEGKNKMSVLNAIRNKLIHRVCAVVRTEIMYQKNYRYMLQES